MMMVFGLLLFTILMLILDILRIDLIAMLVMLTLGWTGILTPREIFSGFSSNAVIAMIAVMMMSHGLSKTGVIDRLSQRIVDPRWSSGNFLAGGTADFAKTEDTGIRFVDSHGFWSNSGCKSDHGWIGPVDRSK